MAESFDAVLAAIRKNGFAGRVELNCLQSAHEAEVAERDEEIRVLHILNAAQAVAITDNADDATLAESRADRAVGLLREIRGRLTYYHPADVELGGRIDAFLSEQAGERENGNG